MLAGVPGVLMVNQGENFTKKHNETLSFELSSTVKEPSSQEVLGMSPFVFGVALTTTAAFTEAGDTSV